MLFTINLEKSHKQPIYMQLYTYVKEEILKGTLSGNEKMPSVRELAQYLSISRNSVENAYNQLVAEGYIISVERKGYYIADLVGDFDRRSLHHKGDSIEDVMVSYPYDFKSEYVSEKNFDYRLWKKHLNYILNYQSQQLYHYGNNRGEKVLREVIAEHFYRTRGINGSASNIVIGAGVSPLLSILVKLLDKMGIDCLGMENPGFNKAKGIFDYSHMRVTPIAVTKKGIDIVSLYKSDVRACFVSPSHQFPTGYIMPIGARQQLIEWAKNINGYIIEDDYNAELRFEGKPIPAMQGLDYNDRVVYLGSFSTVLAPGIRVSFMVLPKQLNDAFIENKRSFSQSASKLEQLALAELIASGDYEKHVRRIRKNYAKKQNLVVAYLKKYLPEEVTILSGKSGLQLSLELPGEIKAQEVIEQCKVKGVLLDRISNYVMGEGEEYVNQLLITYRGIEESKLEDGLKIIGQTIKQLQSLEG